MQLVELLSFFSLKLLFCLYFRLQKLHINLFLSQKKYIKIKFPQVNNIAPPWLHLRAALLYFSALIHRANTDLQYWGCCSWAKLKRFTLILCHISEQSKNLMIINTILCIQGNTTLIDHVIILHRPWRTITACARDCVSIPLIIIKPWTQSLKKLLIIKLTAKLNAKEKNV